MSERKIGIYKILNRETGDFYIGSSQDIAGRWKKHRWQLNIGAHTNSILLRAWNKYGIDAFEFSVLELTSVETLLKLEQHYLDTLKPVYNISLDAYSPMLGRKHSEESKLKISQSNIGLHDKVFTDDMKEESRAGAIRGGLNKPVIALDPTTREIRHRFETISDIKSLGWKKSAVIRCCKGQMQSYQGLLWEYENPADKERVIKEVSDETRAKLSIGRKGKAHTAEMKEALRALKPKRQVASFNLETGDIIKAYDRTKQVRDDGFSQARVVLCCQGKAHTHSGMGWKYLS